MVLIAVVAVLWFLLMAVLACWYCRRKAQAQAPPAVDLGLDGEVVLGRAMTGAPRAPVARGIAMRA